MISALIPIYNFDVTAFINELHVQFEREGKAYEILMTDDASEEHFRKINSELQSLSHVKYIQLQKNIGRARIRNYMANEAKYEYLLFMDCDSEIQGDDFVKKYIHNVNNNTIICGGRSYHVDKPVDHTYVLRWHYGMKRESTDAETRNKFPMRSFMTNNYLIPKEIHQFVKFDEQLVEYGHEDTLFGIELKRLGYTVRHINNPLVHIGLELADEFISKTLKAIENLVYIKENYRYSELDEDIKLLRVYNAYVYLRAFFRLIFRLFSKPLKRNFKSKRPSLFLFDVYKISYLSRYYKCYQRP
jgi:glycosyltransferase involved in cell wall biosynthesis